MALSWFAHGKVSCDAILTGADIEFGKQHVEGDTTSVLGQSIAGVYIPIHMLSDRQMPKSCSCSCIYTLLADYAWHQLCWRTVIPLALASTQQITNFSLCITYGLPVCVTCVLPG